MIAAQLMDVCIRVQAIRSFAISEMTQVLDIYASTSQFTIMQEVLYAAAWLCGEFAIEVEDPEKTLKSMMSFRNLPQHIECVFIQNSLKLFARIVEKYEGKGDYGRIVETSDLMTEKLSESVKSGELEVQERASTTLMIVEIVKVAMLESK